MTRSARSGLMGYSSRDIEGLYPSMRDAYHHLESRRDPQRPSVANTGLEAIEVGAGAALVGLLAGRLGTTSIGSTGIPLGLVLSAAGHTAAYFNLAGRASDDLKRASNGAFAGWLTLWAAGQGRQMRISAGQPDVPITAGREAPPLPYAAAPQMNPPNYATRMPLTESELAAMAQNVRNGT